MLKTLYFNEKTMQLLLIDQVRIPETITYVACDTVEALITAIQGMVVRGAPAIGVAACFGCVLAANEVADTPTWREELAQKIDQLAQARPTAVNLSWACTHMLNHLHRHAPANPAQAKKLLLAEALRMEAKDITTNRAIGRFGATLLADGDCVLTHCNAGALATVAYGTALGVIRHAVADGKRIQVIADETRPLFQGARLTAQELLLDGIPVTVACDNACCLLMMQGRINRVVVGADRIAKNGDTANKIGTAGVAVLAHHFGIPFYVAAPLSTIDPTLATGKDIPIEERGRDEVACVNGKALVPEGVPVINYAFDVTPQAYISAIITEAGILTPPYDEAITKAFAGELC